MECAHERVAQSVEHVTFNHGVVGSIPTALTSTIDDAAIDLRRRCLAASVGRCDKPNLTLSRRLGEKATAPHRAAALHTRQPIASPPLCGMETVQCRAWDSSSPLPRPQSAV